MKLTKSIFVSESNQCKICEANKYNLWLCLSVRINKFRKDADNSIVGNIISIIYAITLNVKYKNNKESKKKKGFHSMFVNVLTA